MCGLYLTQCFPQENRLWPFCCGSVAESCPALCDPVDCSTPGFPVLHHILDPAQTHVHRVSVAIQPFHPLSPPSLPALNLFQLQGLFQWVHSSHQLVKVLDHNYYQFSSNYPFKHSEEFRKRKTICISLKCDQRLSGKVRLGFSVSYLSISLVCVCFSA